MNTNARRERRWPRLDWSTSHWLHTAFAVAAIWLYILGGMAQTEVAGLDPRFDLTRLDYPVSLGQYTVNSDSELLARVAGEPIGYQLELRSADDTVVRVNTYQRHFYFHNLILCIHCLFMGYCY